jgi:antirestriction protein ArdC
MAHRRLQSSRLALLAGLVGVFLLAPVPRVSAEPIDPQANSLQSAVDSFVACLKTETNAAMTGAARLAREHKDDIDAAKARVDAALAELRAALSDHKEGLDTLSKDAAALSEAWREVAVSSWAKIAQSARDALAEIDAWSRNQSLPDDDSEIQV